MTNDFRPPFAPGPLSDEVEEDTLETSDYEPLDFNEQPRTDFFYDADADDDGFLEDDDFEYGDDDLYEDDL